MDRFSLLGAVWIIFLLTIIVTGSVVATNRIQFAAKGIPIKKFLKGRSNLKTQRMKDASAYKKLRTWKFPKPAEDGTLVPKRKPRKLEKPQNSLEDLFPKKRLK